MSTALAAVLNSGITPPGHLILLPVGGSHKPTFLLPVASCLIISVNVLAPLGLFVNVISAFPLAKVMNFLLPVDQFTDVESVELNAGL